MPYDPVHDTMGVSEEQQPHTRETTDSETASDDLASSTMTSATTTATMANTAPARVYAPRSHPIHIPMATYNPDIPPQDNLGIGQTVNRVNKHIATPPAIDSRIILKHRLDTTPRGSSPLKKARKLHNNVLSSARSRHLKKEDGQPFWRKDIQYSFLKAVFDNDVKAFTDPFPDSEENVRMEDRKLDPRGKLSFAELYIKSIAHSSKCSKVLKDRLLHEMKMSMPTSMICLLVNVGRMNTTINFVPEMKSQLRTYHPIPSLQVNYDSATTGNDKSNDKQLQDTPRLKSILKACCDDTNEPSTMEALEQRNVLPTTSCVNMIFVLCNEEDKVLREFFADTAYSFFDIFVNPTYDPRSRSDLFLWLLWTYLESRRTPEEFMMNPFGSKRPFLKPAVMEFDIDTPLEREFGVRLLDQRIKYLAEETTSANSDKKIVSPVNKTSTVASSHPTQHAVPHSESLVRSPVATLPAPTQSSSSSPIDRRVPLAQVKSPPSPSTTETHIATTSIPDALSEPPTTQTPQQKVETLQQEQQEQQLQHAEQLQAQKKQQAQQSQEIELDKQLQAKQVQQAKRIQQIEQAQDAQLAYQAQQAEQPSHHVQLPPPPPPLVLRQDIDVDKVRTSVKTLRKNAYRKRVKHGLVQLEDSVISKEENTEEESSAGRLRLKTYKGDYGEYSNKFNQLFHLLKSDFTELNKDDMKRDAVTIDYEYEQDSLTLKKFDIK